MLPLVPVIVSVYVPKGVPGPVATVRVDDPEPPLIEDGLKLAVALAGRPLALSVTEPLNPPCGETDTPKLAFTPADTVSEPGVNNKEKPGGNVLIVRDTLRFVLRVPPVPVTVST